MNQTEALEFIREHLKTLMDDPDNKKMTLDRQMNIHDCMMAANAALKPKKVQTR